VSVCLRKAPLISQFAALDIQKERRGHYLGGERAVIDVEGPQTRPERGGGVNFAQEDLTFMTLATQRRETARQSAIGLLKEGTKKSGGAGREENAYALLEKREDCPTVKGREQEM